MSLPPHLRIQPPPLKVAGRCPRCGGGMVEFPACCALRGKGFKTMLKCPRSKCGHKVGYRK